MTSASVVWRDCTQWRYAASCPFPSMTRWVCRKINSLFAFDAFLVRTFTVRRLFSCLNARVHAQADSPKRRQSTLETSAVLLVTVANLRFQLSWYNLITLLPPPTKLSPCNMNVLHVRYCTCASFIIAARLEDSIGVWKFDFPLEWRGSTV